MGRPWLPTCFQRWQSYNRIQYMEKLGLYRRSLGFFLQMHSTLENEDRLLKALHSSRPVSGYTHPFYRYPARMVPELARELIQQFSQPGDVVLDPFMGGGTSIVEALAAGRYTIGIDLNPLAAFLADVKTTPLSPRDQVTIRLWASRLDFDTPIPETRQAHDIALVKNLPTRAVRIFGHLINKLERLRYPRQERFARCCLLRLGQWAVEGRSTPPSKRALREQLLLYVDEMLAGLDELVTASQQYGVAKNKLTERRSLLLRSAAGADTDSRLRSLASSPSLIVTSPPYPSVHVLYHRWQVEGRRETPAPYWFIGSNDGRGAAYYTMGSRSPLGLETYFETIVAAYNSVRLIISPKALVAQLVSFADPAIHLPAFLKAMERAGYEEVRPFNARRTDLWRTVPNRKWYNRVDAARGTGTEVLLFHRPRG
jgi:hypothetical protein